MSVDPLAFLDEPQLSPDSTDDPLDFLEETSNSFLRKPARHAAQAAKGSLNLIPQVAAYNLLTTAIPEGAHRSRERVSEQAKKDLATIEDKKELGIPLSRKERIFYDRTKQLAERKSEKAISLDTESLINRAVKSATGIDLRPEDLGEEITNIASSLLSPRTLVTKAQNIPKLFTSAGRQVLKEEKIASSYDALKRFVKGDPLREELLTFARENKFTPREATLLVQSEGKMDKLLRLSRKTKGFKKDVEGIQQKLSNKYEELKAIGSSKGKLGSSVTSPLVRDFENLIGDIDKTLFQGTETVGARKALNNTLTRLENQGTTLEELINTRQNLGQQINWEKVDSKGNLLKRGREFLAQAVERADPYVGKQLRLTDKGWERFEKLRPVLEKKGALIKTKWGEIPAEYLVFGLGYFSPTVLKGLAVREGIKRFSTLMLTNPKLQGAHKRFIDAVTHPNPDQRRKLIVSATKLLKKEDPDLFEEMGFESEDF